MVVCVHLPLEFVDIGLAAADFEVALDRLVHTADRTLRVQAGTTSAPPINSMMDEGGDPSTQVYPYHH